MDKKNKELLQITYDIENYLNNNKVLEEDFEFIKDLLVNTMYRLTADIETYYHYNKGLKEQHKKEEEFQNAVFENIKKTKEWQERHAKRQKEHEILKRKLEESEKRYQQQQMEFNNYVYKP